MADGPLPSILGQGQFRSNSGEGLGQQLAIITCSRLFDNVFYYRLVITGLFRVGAAFIYFKSGNYRDCGAGMGAKPPTHFFNGQRNKRIKSSLIWSYLIIDLKLFMPLLLSSMTYKRRQTRLPYSFVSYTFLCYFGTPTFKQALRSLDYCDPKPLKYSSSHYFESIQAAILSEVVGVQSAAVEGQF